MQSPLWMNRIARLVRSSRGSASPEYAILTLALFGIAIPAIGSLGQLVGHVFSDVQLGPAASVVSITTTAAVTTGTSPAATIPEALSSWTRSANALAFVVVASAMVWLFLRKKSRNEIGTPRPLAEDLNKVSSLSDVEKRQQIVKRLCRDTDTLLQGDLEMRYVMTMNPVTVEPRDTVEHARTIMEKQHLDYVRSERRQHQSTIDRSHVLIPATKTRHASVSSGLREQSRSPVLYWSLASQRPSRFATQTDHLWSDV